MSGELATFDDQIADALTERQKIDGRLVNLHRRRAAYLRGEDPSEWRLIGHITHWESSSTLDHADLLLDPQPEARLWRVTFEWTLPEAGLDEEIELLWFVRWSERQKKGIHRDMLAYLVARGSMISLMHGVGTSQAGGEKEPVREPFIPQPNEKYRVEILIDAEGWAEARGIAIGRRYRNIVAWTLRTPPGSGDPGPWGFRPLVQFFRTASPGHVLRDARIEVKP